MSEPKTITMSEWEKLSYSGISADTISLLEAASDKLGGRIFDFFRHELRARNFVGVVATSGMTVEILPKIHDDKESNLGYLLALLRYTGSLATKRGDIAGLSEHRGSFLEAWIQHFATELNSLLRRNYKQKYIEIEERSPFVRGKLLTERDLDRSSALSARYPCRYEIFTPDHLLNRTLKFCNSLLMKQTRAPKNRTTLRENDFLLADVSDVPVFVRDLDRIHLDRLNREYDRILELCRLLLENSALDLRAGRITQLAIVFDMNKLFEKFVAEFLRRHVGRMRFAGDILEAVRAPRRVGTLFGEFKMEVDVEARAGGRWYLFDTKYKKLDAADDHGGLSQPDFYQMYAYANAGEKKYEGVVLLYPTTSEPRRTDFAHEGTRLHVRHFDPADIYDAKSGGVDEARLAERLERAFSTIGEGVPV